MLLLKNGTVIIHGSGDIAEGIKTDILVKENKIVDIAVNISSPDGVEIIDCTDKIVAPGFVDTHRHMWNIALRGRHGNNLLTDYIIEGILQSSNYDPDDVFWGQLAGCLEAIDAGTTTVVDHSHLNYSPEHPKAAIAATVASGIRSIYGYCFTGRVASWSPFSFAPNPLEPWVLETLKELSQSAPFGDGRVILGLAFDLWFLPKEILVPLFEQIRSFGVDRITTHQTPPPPGQPSSIELLESYGLLSSSVLLSHANRLSPTDIALIKKRNAHISSTPSLELQMAMGEPACFDHHRDIASHCSLGVDCHNVTLASLPAEMRVALAHGRGVVNNEYLNLGKYPANIFKSVQDVYALGTIGGARAIGLEHQIGSIAVGKTADIIIFDTLTPNMLAGAQQDPIAAIVMHSTPRDITTTIVDGIIRKKDGILLPVKNAQALTKYTGDKLAELSWHDIAKEVLRTREGIQSRFENIDFEAAGRVARAVFGFSEDRLLEALPTQKSNL